MPSVAETTKILATAKHYQQKNLLVAHLLDAGLITFEQGHRSSELWNG